MAICSIQYTFAVTYDFLTAPKIETTVEMRKCQQIQARYHGYTFREQPFKIRWAISPPSPSGPNKVEPQNSACGIVTYRRDTRLICSFLREVWGGGKGEGNVSSVRASTQPDTTVGTVRFCTLYTKVFSRSKSRLCPFYILVWYLLCWNVQFSVKF